jgi:MFS family permease
MSRKLPPAEEATPLLDRTDTQAQEPFPYQQIVPLCFARLPEAWTFWTVFPFVPALLKRSGIPETDLGYFAGLIEGIFSATQVVTMLLLGTISERWGRKSVLCFCLLGLSICSTCFGFATSVWQMVLFRSGSGIFSACTV